MKRTPQEMIELAVFGLIGLLVGTGVLWLVGSLLRLLGAIFVWIAAALWTLISFLVPVALIAGAIVLGVRWAQGRPWQPFGGSDAPPPYPSAPSATTVTVNGATVPRPPSEPDAPVGEVASGAAPETQSDAPADAHGDAPADAHGDAPADAHGDAPADAHGDGAHPSSEDPDVPRS